jgi:hypothetical protein
MKSYGKAIGQRWIFRRSRPTLQITYLHLFRIVSKGDTVSNLDYHRKGITPDAVSSPLIVAGANAPDKALFYAVKTLQPSSTKIKYPSGKSGLFKESQSGLYKTVNEEDLDL